VQLEALERAQVGAHHGQARLGMAQVQRVVPGFQGIEPQAGPLQGHGQFLPGGGLARLQAGDLPQRIQGFRHQPGAGQDFRPLLEELRLGPGQARGGFLQLAQQFQGGQRVLLLPHQAEEQLPRGRQAGLFLPGGAGGVPRFLEIPGPGLPAGQPQPGAGGVPLPRGFLQLREVAGQWRLGPGGFFRASPVCAPASDLASAPVCAPAFAIATAISIAAVFALGAGFRGRQLQRERPVRLVHGIGLAAQFQALPPLALRETALHAGRIPPGGGAQKLEEPLVHLGIGGGGGVRQAVQDALQQDLRFLGAPGFRKDAGQLQHIGRVQRVQLHGHLEHGQGALRVATRLEDAMGLEAGGGAARGRVLRHHQAG
jgi:hypothetical protein